MLAAGGTAIDAAIASLFALTVVEPMMVGVFGAGMSTIRLANGDHHCINNYSRAPAAASADMYDTISDSWPDYQTVANKANDVGPLSVGVPGTLKGWCEALDSYGTMSLDDVLQPAIRYARRGFPATQYLHEIIQLVAEDLAKFPETAKTFLPGGIPVAAGAKIVQPEYAQTLELIAHEGPSALYGGELGRVAAEHIQATGGILTLEDLLGYRTAHTDVVRGRYRDCEFIGPAPP